MGGRKKRSIKDWKAGGSQRMGIIIIMEKVGSILLWGHLEEGGWRKQAFRSGRLKEWKTLGSGNHKVLHGRLEGMGGWTK